LACTGAEKPAQALAECLLERRLVFFQRLLDPPILEQLAPRSQEVVSQKKDRLGGSAQFRARVVLGQPLRPVPKLCDSVVVEDGSS